MRSCLLAVVVATSLLSGALTAAAQPASAACSAGFEPLQPGASIPSLSCTVIDAPGATFTTANGINDRSQIVGSFATDGKKPGDPTQKTHGFLRTNGQFIPIDAPNADRTEVWGINSRTQIVGFYVVNGQSHGVLVENNRFTTVEPPGATSSIAYGINDLGQIVGTYTDGAGAHGYLWTHGRFTLVDVPVVPAASSEPRGINRIGQVVGFHTAPNRGGFANFRLGADGSVAALTDFPSSGVVATPQGINDRGEIVGQLLIPVGVRGLLVAFGQETFFSISSGESAGASGINNRGQIAGHFCSFTGDCHGVLLTPPNVAEDVSASASPDGSRVPVVTVIVDNALATWTLGPGEEILRNGVQAAGAYGSQILWYRNAVYVLGDDYNWWKWTGTTWTFAGASDPTS
jgi:probable HAF family extracellular repeat protein